MTLKQYFFWGFETQFLNGFVSFHYYSIMSLFSSLLVFNVSKKLNSLFQTWYGYITHNKSRYIVYLSTLLSLGGLVIEKLRVVKQRLSGILLWYIGSTWCICISPLLPLWAETRTHERERLTQSATHFFPNERERERSLI